MINLFLRLLQRHGSQSIALHSLNASDNNSVQFELIKLQTDWKSARREGERERNTDSIAAAITESAVEWVLCWFACETIVNDFLN